MNRWGRQIVLLCTVLGLAMAGCAERQKQVSEPEFVPKVEAPVSRPAMTVVSMAYPTGAAETSAICLEKTIPTEVAINEPFTYEIRATNLTDAPLHNVIVSDGMSSNIEVQSTTPEGESHEERTISWDLGTLGADMSKTITITAVATGRNRISSCASVTYNSMLCADAVVVAPELVLTKTGPSEVLLCDPIVYTLTVSNAGTGTVEGVQITDALPEGLLAVDGRSTVDIEVGALNAGQSRAFEVKVKASERGEYSNAASATSAGELEANSREVVTVVREPVLSITDTGPGRRYLGRRATHEIVVSNTGDGNAPDTVVTAELSPNANFISASDGGTVEDGKVTWKLGTLAADQSKTVKVTLSTDIDGTISTAAKAEAYCASPVAASAETAYEGIPAILLEVIDIEDPIEVGAEATYRVTATNQGSAAATGVTIVCSLEGNVEYVSSAGATAGEAGDGIVAFAPLTSLAPGEVATWNIVVKALEAGDVRFHVRMTSDQLTRPVQETEATNLYEGS